MFFHATVVVVAVVVVAAAAVDAPVVLPLIIVFFVGCLQDSRGNQGAARQVGQQRTVRALFISEGL